MESYEAARAVLASCELKPQDILEGKAAGIAKKLQTAKLAKQLGIGELTLTDIVKELEKPSRDPRDEMPKPILRSDVLSMEDLKPDMELKGTVRNVVDFGAFVDIGVHEDGLVHLSQLCNRYVKHPSEVVSVGDIVNYLSENGIFFGAGCKSPLAVKSATRIFAVDSVSAKIVMNNSSQLRNQQ